MKIALDVDGVIDRAPAFFAAVTHALRSAGHEVHVISDFDEGFRQQREKELADWGIGFDRFEIAADKASYCRNNGIDFAIDDDPEEYFPGMAVALVGLVVTDHAT